VNDYYPFGMQMPGRKFSAAGSGYRYGFNGKEKDNEVKGDGNQIAYEARMYDPRIGRLLSIDPLAKNYPWYTPFQFAGNDVIRCSDLLGKQPESRTGEWNKGHKTSFLSGGSYIDIWDKSRSELFEATGVYDPATGKTWIVARTPANQYFYLVNDNKSTDKLYSGIQNGERVLMRGHFERFETQDSKDAKSGAAIADGIGTAVFGIAAFVAALPAIAAATSSVAAATSTAASTLTAKAATLYGTYAATAANVANNYLIPLLDQSGQSGSLTPATFRANALNHIFDETQQLTNTPQSRQLLLDVASNVENFLGKDKHGNEWFGKILESGKQLWAQKRGNEVINGGLNDEVVNFVENEGLKLVTETRK
jgi:RHS repeat-associated protein